MPLRDLHADLVANLARIAFAREGRGRWAAALTYRALDLDPRNATAIITLSGYMDASAASLPSGFTQLSALVLEYALTDECGLSPGDRERCAHERRFALWSWAFSRHASGAKELVLRDFDDGASFVVDEARYAAWRDPALTATGSLRGAFEVARSVMGLFAGFLDKRDASVAATVCGAYPPGSLVANPDAYEAWLDRDATEVEQRFRA